MSSFGLQTAVDNLLANQPKQRSLQQEITDKVLGLTVDEKGQPYYANLVSEDQVKDINDTIIRSLGRTVNQKALEDIEQEISEIKAGSDRFLDKFAARNPTQMFNREGPTNRDSLFIDRDGVVQKDWMSYNELTHAGNIYGNVFEFLGMSANTAYEKANLSTSDALFMGSKAYGKMKAMLDGNTTPEQYEFLQASKYSPSYIKKSLKFLNPYAYLDPITGLYAYEGMLQTLPLASSFYATENNAELVLFQKKDPEFDGSALLNLIQKEDPEFWAYLQNAGLTEDDLTTANNAFDFRYRVNSAVNNKAMAQAAEVYSMTAGPIEKAARFTWDQLTGTIDSPDMVGQVVIAAATAGVGTAISGAATFTARAGLATAQTGARAAKIAERAAKIHKVGQAIKKTQDYLPVNIASTLLNKTVGPTVGNAKWMKYFVGPMATEFVEEGAIDVANQLLNIHKLDTQVSFDYGQMTESAFMGAAMGPVLAGAFKVAGIPISIAGYGLRISGNAISDFAVTRVLDINPSRLSEFRLYMNAFTGTNLGDLSVEEQHVRLAAEARALVTESLLNEMSNNTFGRLEDKKNEGFVSAIRALSNIEMASENTNQKSALGAVLAVNEWLNNLNTGIGTFDPTTGAFQSNKLSQFIQEHPGFLAVRDDGKVTMSLEALETVVRLVAAGNQTTFTDASEIGALVLRTQIEGKLAEKHKAAGMTETEVAEAVKKDILENSESFKEEETKILALQSAASKLLSENPPTNTSSTEAPDQDLLVNQAENADIIARNTAEAVAKATPKAAPVTAPTAPETAPTAPETAPTAPVAAPTAPEVAPEPETKPTSATITNAIDIVMSKPELISLISKICK
jgi:hypothetical protein